jgi:dienelactone hydrolase
MRVKRKTSIGLGVALLIVLIGIIWCAASFRRLALLAPSGPHAVGRLRLNWIDDQRPELFVPRSRREVVAEVWYPAEQDSGQVSAYFPELPTVSTQLVEIGELSLPAAWALGSVRSFARANADFVTIAADSPVIILSPGNATNVEFHSALAEDLASHGYVVFGINHPYDVGAVRLSDGSIATYRDRVFGDHEALGIRMRERVSDALFLLDQLPRIDTGTSVLAGRLDLARVGIMGHSLGGLTAAEVCVSDRSPSACINIDGLYAGNPYGASQAAQAPQQPFLYLGKERTIGSRTAGLLDGREQVELVSIRDATHESFQDGSLFKPTPNPWDGAARHILDQSRSAIVDFFDRHLRSRQETRHTPDLQ